MTDQPGGGGDEGILMLVFLAVAVIVLISKARKHIYRTRMRFHEITGIPKKRHQRTTYSSTGRTYIDENGYRRFSDSDDLVHRWVASKKLGRKLGRREVVHHIDHDKLSNSPENLYVCRNQREHERIHENDAR
jgi:hypothetical protein